MAKKPPIKLAADAAKKQAKYDEFAKTPPLS